MTPEKILQLIDLYEEMLCNWPKINYHSSYLDDLNKSEILSYAHHLCGIAPTLKHENLNYCLAAIQTCLSFAGWFTLDDIREHNS